MAATWREAGRTESKDKTPAKMTGGEKIGPAPSGVGLFSSARTDTGVNPVTDRSGRKVTSTERRAIEEALARKAPSLNYASPEQPPPRSQPGIAQTVTQIVDPKQQVMVQQGQAQLNLGISDDGGENGDFTKGLTPAQYAKAVEIMRKQGKTEQDIKNAIAENQRAMGLAPGTDFKTTPTHLMQDWTGKWESDGARLNTIKMWNAAKQGIDLSAPDKDGKVRGNFSMAGNEGVARDKAGNIVANGFINPVTGQFITSYSRPQGSSYGATPDIDPVLNSGYWGSFIGPDATLTDARGQSRPYGIEDTWRDHGVGHVEDSYLMTSDGQTYNRDDLTRLAHGDLQGNDTFAYHTASRLGQESQDWVDKNWGSQEYVDRINANSANNGLSIPEAATDAQRADWAKHVEALKAEQVAGGKPLLRSALEQIGQFKGITSEDGEGDVLSQVITNPSTAQGYDTFVTRNGQKLAATIGTDNKTYLKDGSALQAGDQVQGRDGKTYTMTAEKVAAQNGGAQTAGGGVYAAKITFTDGTQGTGYIIDGKTYLDPQGTQRVPGGTKVIDRQGREWTMKDAGDGGSTQELTPNSMLQMLMDEMANPVDYSQIVNESAALFAQMFPETGVSMPTWEQAMKDAAAAMADTFAMQDEELARATDQGLLASGLFGQIPGEVIKRELMLKQKGIQGQAVAGMAQNIYQTGAQNAQWEKQFQLQKQQQFLSVLNNAYERAVGQKAQNQNLILQMYNILTQQQSAAAQAAQDEREWQLKLANYDLDYQKVLNDTNYTNARIEDILASKSGGGGGSSSGSGRSGGGATTTVEGSTLSSWISASGQKTPNALISAVTLGRVAPPKGMTANQAIYQIQNAYRGALDRPFASVGAGATSKDPKLMSNGYFR